jgi:hypothetical protein
MCEAAASRLRLAAHQPPNEEGTRAALKGNFKRPAIVLTFDI